MDTNQFKELVNKYLNNTISLMHGSEVDATVVTYFISAVLDEFKLPNNKEAIEKFKTCIDSLKDSITVYSKVNKELDDITRDNFDKINSSFEELNKQEIKKHFDDFHNKLIAHINNANIKIREIATKLNEMEENSSIDKLTKLFNAKALRDDLSLILIHGMEKKLDLNVLTININNFKDFSLQYKDEIVKKTNLFLALVIKSLIRKENRIYRISDYQFAVVFNRSQIDEVSNSAKRILNHLNKNRVIYNNIDVKFFVSLIIYAHQKGDSYDAIFEKISNIYKTQCSENNSIITI